MKKVFLIYIFSLLVVISNSQTLDKKYYLVDSLKKEQLSTADIEIIDDCLAQFYKAQTDTDKVNAVYLLIDESNNDEVWPMYNKWLYNFIREKLSVNQPKDVERSLKLTLASVINNIGYYYKNLGDIPEALNYYHQSLKLQEELKNDEGAALTLNNIGTVYDEQGKSKLALEYYEKSLKIREYIKDKYGMAMSYNNIGGLFYNEKNLDEALKYYSKSLELLEEMGDAQGQAYAMNNLGKVYRAMNSIPKALDFLFKGLNLRKESNDKTGMANSLYNIGNLKLQQGILDGKEGALSYALQSMDVSKELGYPRNIRDAADLLSQIYEKQGKEKESLNMYKLYIRMRDSLINEDTHRATIHQQAQYKYTKQKAIDDAAHEKQIAIEQQKEEKQKVVIYAITAGLILVVGFLIFAYNRLQITGKQKRIIEEQKNVVERAKQLLEEKNKETHDSITYAKRIQTAILPSGRLFKSLLPESFVLYKPKDIVAGDFYWIDQVNDTILLAAADCTGHGVPGAMVSVVCNYALNRSVREFNLTDPGQILNKTREIVISEFEKSDEDVKDGMDISLCSINLKKNELKWAGANNPLWIINSERHECPEGTIPFGGELGGFEVKPNKQPIGKYTNPQPFKTHAIQLNSNDILFLFTDGYKDQFGGPSGKKFKASKLKELLCSIQNNTMDKQEELIDHAFMEWKGDFEQVDDVCLIGIKI